MITRQILSTNRFKCIITHNDFDGIVSGALVSKALRINKVIFSSPSAIENRKIRITQYDILCDLPYSTECGLWFDHHEGNLEQLKYLGIEVEKIIGVFELKQSCARVIHDTFKKFDIKLPDYFDTTVNETDIIDSFSYENVEQWRRETPANIINQSIKCPESDIKKQKKYLYFLLKSIKEMELEKVSVLSKVRERYNKYKTAEERMINIIKKSSYFLPQDGGKEMVIVDLTEFPKRILVDKKLAYILYPEVKAVLSVYNLFDMGRKTTNLGFSMSINTLVGAEQTGKDIGEIMRNLNIGDGHRGAAGASIMCGSKAEMLKEKKRYLNEIFEQWTKQTGNQ